MYGITETTVHVTYRPLTRADLDAPGSVIGGPIPDLRVYVLDPEGRPQPIGVPGEMYVGGGGVARGYLGRPELTGQRFLPDPFGGVPGGRLYRTGDLARYLLNGDLEYLGRIDQQVKIRGFRIELGEIEACLARHPGVGQCAVICREDLPGDKRLVAYLVPDAAAAASPNASDLRRSLEQRLPPYMVPAAFVFLPDALPLTTNGKLDKRALPAPEPERPELGRVAVAPRTPLESRLAAIWRDVLRLDEVGVHDNFFELGGDSILSIHIIARARQAGVPLTPRLLFAHPTIAALAAAAAAQAEAAAAVAVPAEPEGAAGGPAPLTPIQRWFFEQRMPEPNHYNQAFLFETAAPLDAALLERAVGHLVAHHDALRLRFARNADGEWVQSCAPAVTEGGAAAAGIVEHVDLSALPANAQRAAVEAAAADAQARLDLRNGPLLRVVRFDRGAGRSGRLLIAVHHLAVDGVSWQILMEDLASAYQQLEGGADPVRLPERTMAFGRWSEALARHAQSDAVITELDHWRNAAAPAAAPLLPPDLPGATDADNAEASARTVTVALDAAETEALLQQVPAAFRTQINDVLLAALALCFADRCAGGALRVDLEGHGREDVLDGAGDVSRTVGWFTTLFPLRLEIDPDGAPPAALKGVKEQLRRVPGRGIGYGLLRYLHADPAVREALAALPPAEVVFNYLGQFDQVVAGGASRFRFAPESTGPWHGPRNRRSHRLEILGRVADGRLQLQWTFSDRLHREETIAALAARYVAALRELIGECVRPGVRGLTPSDVPLAPRLDQATLDALLARYGDAEDVYPLSPMQQLFLSASATAPELGIEQWHFALRGGPVDAGALRRAWEEALNRHAILRTVFVSDGLPEPLQVVRKRVDLCWSEHDGRGLSAAEQDEWLRAFLRADRQRGFDPAVAPLTRVALLRTADEAAHLIWSTHHLQIDGWSWPLVWKDVSALYAAFRGRGITATTAAMPALEPAPGYRDYIAWRQEHGAAAAAAEAEAYWHRTLRGFTRPTPLPGGNAPAGPVPTPEGDDVREREIRLSPDTSAALQRLARQHRLTLSLLVQGAWALLLSHHGGGESDVVFGASFSGRPASLPGVEAIVGPFVNNLPIRVEIASEVALIPWLKRLQEGHAERSHHQDLSLLRIQEVSEVPWRYRLFDSLVVFQNYRVEDASRRLGGDGDDGVEVDLVASPDRTGYPLTLVAVPGPELLLKAAFRPRFVGEDAAATLLRDLETLLEAMAASVAAAGGEGDVGPTLGALLRRLPAPVRPAPTAAAAAFDPKAGAPAAVGAAPQTGHERVIAAVWRDALGVDDVGLDDNLFELGAHSLLVVRVHARLREELPADLPIIKMFQYPTIRSLARHLSRDTEEPAFHGAARDRAQRQKEALAAAARRRSMQGR
jgi:non-ribosomal peptide synthase protein (TIGR01720 family)